MKGLLLAASGLVLLACASGGGSGSATSTRSIDVITAEEVASANVTTAYQLVQRLRPRWLRSRGPASLTGGDDVPVVYVDEVRAGGFEVLERMSTRIVERISFMSGRDASVKYGMGHGGGAIMVETIRH